MPVFRALVIGLVVAATAAGPAPRPPQSGAPDIREVELSVRTGDGQVLPATLRVPANAHPGLPGMVLVHGAGAGPREYYRAEAEAFARAGIVTLSYDKRTVGYSLTRRSYALLADDAIAAAELLRGRPEIDAAAVGFWGLSEGGWVAPLAASRDPRTAFLVVVGANGIPPLRQHSWAERLKVEHAGVRGSMVDAYSHTFWRLITALGMFAEPYHDPAPALRSLTLPVLGIWGAKDRISPPVEGVSAFRALLDAAGNQRYTLRTVDDAEHQIKLTTDGWTKTEAFAPGYVDLVGSWVRAAATGRAPSTTVEGTGEQRLPTSEITPPAWYESAPVQLTALGAIVAGFGGYLLASAWRRLRGGDRTPRRAVVMAAAGLLAAPGALLYLGHVQAVSGGTITTNGVLAAGPMLAGRPLAWLGLQALAVTTVAAGVATAAHRGQVPGRRVLLAAGALFVPWALHWGLLLP
jgi:pimeloyl-ACP methyl ester carboxylesterase